MCLSQCHEKSAKRSAFQEVHLGYQRVSLSLKPADLLPILKFLIFLDGGLKNEFLMMKKSNFYNVFKHIFHFKCKTVYTFKAFFWLPSSTGFQKMSRAVTELSRVIQFCSQKKLIQESNSTEKIRRTMPGTLPA